MASNGLHQLDLGMSHLLRRGCWSNDDQFGPVVVGCRNDFDFTLYFEQSILSIGPSALFILFATWRIIQLYRSSIKTSPSDFRFVKLGAAILYACLQMVLFILWARKTSWKTGVAVPAAAVGFLSSLFIAILSYAEHTRSVRPSMLLNTFLFFSLILDIPQARTLFLIGHHHVIASVFVAALAAKLALLILEAKEKQAYLKPRYKAWPPEASSNIFNQTTFWWLNSLFYNGARKILSPQDLYTIDEELSSEVLGQRLITTWNARTKPESRRSLPTALAVALKWPLIYVVFPRLCVTGFSYSQPFLISASINYVSTTGSSTHDKDEGYGLVLAALFIYVGIAIANVHYKHRLYRAMTMIRGAMIVLIYNHTFTLQVDQGDNTAAVSLMGTDTDSIVNSLESAYNCWSSIIEISIGVYLLARQIGWQAVMPLVVVVLSTFGSGRVAKLIGPKMRGWMGAVQRRVSMTSSLLGSIKLVKMLGLTNLMHATIRAQRIQELEEQKRFRWMMVWLNIFAMIPSILGPVITFSAIAIQSAVQGNPSLSATKAFTSYSIILLITGPATQLLAAVPSLSAVLGNYDRIQKYLLNDGWTDGRKVAVRENTSSSSFKTVEMKEMKSNSTSSEERSIIRIKNAYIKPSPIADFSLQNLTLDIIGGSITMIMGPVGCGKTILLKAMLGEAPCELGDVLVSGVDGAAYCCQKPWLFNGTVRENIIGSVNGIDSNFDEKWYRTVIYSCSLDIDLLQLPEGDETNIGSQGTALSGGQKQRIALARAVYSRKSLLVLDDIFSALDRETEDSIVNRLLGDKGILKGLDTTVIIATHTSRHLLLADRIIILSPQSTILFDGNARDLELEDPSMIPLLPLSVPKTESPELQDKTKNNTKPDTNSQQEKAEDLARKIGDLSVYKYYIKSIGWERTSIFLAVSVLAVFCRLMSQVWLKWWADRSGGEIGKYMSIYAVLSFGFLIFNAACVWSIFIHITPKAAATLHEILLSTVMWAPQQFFSVTDTGTMLNRFSQDMTLIEGSLPTAALITATYFITTIGQLALISTGSGYMALTIPFVIGIIYLLQNIYLRTSRQLRFMDLEAKAPIYSHFTETIEGLATIRSFRRESQAKLVHIQRLDASQKPYYLLYCIQRWLNLVLDLVVAGLGVVLIGIAVSLRNQTSGGLLGVALINILNFNLTLTSLVTYWTQLETSLGAIARLKNFEAQTPREAKSREQQNPPETWPEFGGIEFRNVHASYKQGSPVLKGISFVVKPGQKIGICGRSGSGKSSLFLTLLRLIEMDATGTIIIDDLDLKDISREVIRERLITLPQESYILPGSVRLNADPSASIPDHVIIEALQRANIWESLNSRGGLDPDLKDGSLSQGQLQLFALARAMLHQQRTSTKVLAMDEATSNIDYATDRLLQQIIKSEFTDKGCTVLMIAHRPESIRDSDVIIVLEDGKIIANGKPDSVLGREFGM